MPSPGISFHVPSPALRGRVLLHYVLRAPPGSVTRWTARGPHILFLAVGACRVALGDGGAASVADALCRRLFADVREHPRVGAVDAWLSRPEVATPDGLMRTLGLSGRQTARLTLATHGGSPGRLVAKHRTLKAALLASGAGGWVEAADGFYDQSHFIRRFKRYVGHTLGAFAGAPAAAVRFLMAGRRASGVTRPLDLWS